MTENNTVRRAASVGAGILAAALAVGTASAQQAATGPRLAAWVGCWTPTAVAPTADSTSRPVTCVVPAGDDAVEMVTLVDGEAVQREVVRVGERRSVEREGCSGWEQVTGSADGSRVYRNAEFTCEGGLERRSTGLMAMSGGEWLDVSGVSAGGHTEAQVVRYRPTGAPAALDPQAREALQGRDLAVESARLAVAGPVGSDDVAEASQHLDPEVVEAWLVEREHGFALDAPQLLELADAGVSERVIDLMVALSYPEVFAVDQQAREGERRPDSADGGQVRSIPMYGWSYPGYGWGYRGYGLGYRGYGWGGYYPGYGYGGYRGSPVVIVRRGADADNDDGGSRAEAPARAIKGRGYTRGGSEPTMNTPARRPSGSISGTSGARGSGGGSAPPRRTAKPRTGGGGGT